MRKAASDVGPHSSGVGPQTLAARVRGLTAEDYSPALRRGFARLPFQFGGVVHEDVAQRNQSL